MDIPCHWFVNRAKQLFIQYILIGTTSNWRITKYTGEWAYFISKYYTDFELWKISVSKKFPGTNSHRYGGTTVFEH